MEQIRLLILEDSDEDFELLCHELKKSEYKIESTRIQTESELITALETTEWNLILSDYVLSYKFNGMNALSILKKKKLNIPFILMSGAVGEEKAAEIMRAGAHDLILKHNLSRIVPVLHREISDEKNRKIMDDARIKSEQEKVRAQEELISAYKMAALGEMAGNIAHEINNPLAIIDGKSQQLCEILEKKPLDSKLAIKFAKVISETALRVVKIVNGLKTFSRKSDRDSFSKKSVLTLVEETIALCSAKLKSQQITLSVSKISPTVEIECRPAEISQVLLNLISNAHDAIENLPEKWIKIELFEGQNFIKIFITDSGNGIPKEIQNKIQEPFFTTKQEGKGTGLGLSISTSLIVAHGGTLQLDHTFPNTRFVITIPVQQQ